MDSRLLTSKRSFDFPFCKDPFLYEVMEHQNQDVDMESASKETENGAKTKQLKQELDPLQIPNILEKVFSYLDAESIKNARQAKKLWSVEGAKMLMNKCYVQIPRDENGICNEMNLFKDFLSLKSSEQSMIPNIYIETFGDFDLWNALGVLGPQVKAVKLQKLGCNFKLLSKVLDFLPNLKYIKCLDFEKDWFHNKNIVPILISTMSKDETKGTTLVISNMSFRVSSTMKVTEMENFSNCTNIMVEELKFYFDTRFIRPLKDGIVDIANIINKILSTNQNTLKRLTWNRCQVLVPLLEFPRMTELTHMDLDFRFGGSTFPSAFQFSEKVPNLQEISTKFNEANVQKLFENTGPAPSVKCVKFLGEYAMRDDTAEFLFKIFPNVKDLQMCGKPQTLQWFNSLWTFGTNLRKLRLVVGLDQLPVNLGLDEIFTGFSFKTVKRVKKHSVLGTYPSETLDRRRVNPSILNLNELEQITIDLDCIHKAYPPKRMLVVAEKYAFRLLPKNPKIVINVKTPLHATISAVGALEEVSQLANVSVERRSCYGCESRL